jgi:N-acetyl-gamma-glutamyl-phosphate reductase
MRSYAGLTHRPVFCPIVGNYYQGMIVSVPLYVRLLARSASIEDVHALLNESYASERYVRVMPLDGGAAVEEGYLSPVGCNGTNRIELFVSGNSEQIVVNARLDNLGKGASLAAVQNVNLMLGFDESTAIVE